MAESRILQIFNELHARGLVLNKKDYAAQIGASYPNVISAMKSEDAVAFTPNLLAKAEALRRRLLPDAAQPARREITIPAETLELYTNLSRTAAQLAETLDRLLAAERGKKDAAG